MPLPRALLRLTDDELDALLSGERTLHAATVSADGWPHVVPLWFVWLDGSIWVNNLRKSRRSRDLENGSRVALCVDSGETYGELRGAVLTGTFEDASADPRLDDVKREFSKKYWNGIEIPDLKSHIWLRFRPERTASWDFAKIPSGRDRRLEATEHTR